MTDAESAVGIAGAVTPVPTGAQSTVAVEALTPDLPANRAEAEASYRAAFGLLKAGQYDESIAAFNTFLQQYPGSEYADNAQYWLGEAYYVKRQFEPAIEHYQRLATDYPQSQKRSHALLKVGYCYHELGLSDQALNVLDALKTEFSGSAAARLADERIQRIRAETR